ncbi:PREDICTED: separin [Nipponia nippon]|uniref:separin n=1 Tax=Nipponia nippon TaxID=128390 RepID=UPI00051097F7|nr:PREDICTED: separin [Nipponia nippon]
MRAPTAGTTTPSVPRAGGLAEPRADWLRRMKPLKGAHFAAQMDSGEGIDKLLAELRGGASDASQTSRLRKSQICDKVLRICVERMAEPGGCPTLATSLVAVAKEACQGYLTTVPQPAPLYLEKILYHLLRNAAGRGSGDACWRVADLLRARLLSYRPGQAPSKDFTAIAYSSFSVLWRGADTLAEPDRPQEEGRAVLSVRLRALRFLLLLEEDGAALLPLQPPFFISQTAQQAAAAAAMYEAQRAPSSAFLGQQLGDCLLAALRKEAAEPPTLQQSLCFFELTLEQCRHLCKSGWHREAEEAVKDARGFLGTTGSSTESFSDPLSLLEAGIQLSRVLAESAGSAGPPLSQAAAALGAAAEASERLLRVLAESCQFIVCSLGDYVKRSRQQRFGWEDVLGLCAFTEGHRHVVQRLLERVPPDGVKQKLMVKQLLYRSLQLFASVAYDAFQCSQPAGWPGLQRLTAGCRRSVVWMLEALEGLPESERAKYLDITVLCTFKLAYIFYSQNLHEEASSICELFCKSPQTADAYAYPKIPPERLHKCFRLQVESYRKLGQLERALACVVQWLAALRGRIGELLAEPVSLWVRVKTDAAKQGAEELRLRTLKEGLEGHSLDTETLVTVLFAELKAYKTVRADTGQERYNVLCDLLEICSEESGRLHERAIGLTELAQVLCYHSYAQQTDCSSLDSVCEALRLLELVPRSAQNQDQLLDDRAQALLWLYICTLESKLEKSIERDQRAKAQGLKSLDDFEPNDLNYEGRLLEDRFLYDGISFNLVTETGEDAVGSGPSLKRLSGSAWLWVRLSQTRGVPSALSKSLDDAFALWKQLLATPGIPAVRSPEQTVASLHLLAALYKLMGKPLQAVESYLLVRALCGALGDSLGTARALCEVTKLLFQLECPSYAQLFLEEMESCLQNADSSDDSYLLLQQTCLLLRSQLCCVNHRIEEGLTLLLGVLQNPALQKITKVWYLLRAHVLQLVAVYLSLPAARLSPELQQWIFVQGWKTPETALAEAHKLFRSIVLLVTGSNLLCCQTTASDFQFVDYGDNLLLKWQVLADMLACSEHHVALLSRLEVMCKAKAFCLEAVKLAMKLQTIRWCASFLVLKAQLELQQNELELSHFDLCQALFLLESDTEFKTSKKQKGQTKILPRKGKREDKKPRDPTSEPPREEESFLKGPAMEFVATVSTLEKADALTTSPELKPERRKKLAFLTHPAACPCRLCSDLALSAVCLRWLLSCAQGKLAAGSAAEGLGLIRATLPRCAAVAARFASVLRDKLWGGSVSRDLPALELLDDLVATGYAMLALQSLASPQLAEELQEELETGLTFLAACRPHLPSLEVSRAILLLAKAMAAVCRLASKHGDSVDGVFAGSWTLQLPTLAPAEPEVAAVPQTLKTDKAQPQRCKTKTTSAPAVPKPRVKKSQRAKPPAVPNADDVFALGDSDGEVAPIVIRPVTVPCTPCQKTHPPAKAQAAPGPRTPFTIFNESSPPAGKARVPRAPRVLGKVKSRLKVTFSDDSDMEDPEAGRTPAATRKTSCTQKALPLKSTASQASSLGFGGQSGSARPRRGRRPPRRAGAAEEKRERMTRRAPSKRAEEERELLRAIGEEEKVEKELEISFEVLRVSEEEEGAPGRRQLPPRRQKGADGEHKVLQQEAGEDALAAQWPGSGDPLRLEGTLSSALPTADDTSSLDAVLKLLKDAFSCISHCPPGALYSQLCQLLALATGNQDPLSTAYLLSESVSVTTRHQLLSVIHRKIHKEKKSAGDVAEQLRGLSLQERSAAQCSHHLAELERLFMFCSTGLGSEVRDGFRTQLQQIPGGVTVCVLTLTSIQPGSVGDTLLLTRLEKGATPVTIRIPTALDKALLRSVLSDFDAIQKEQKEANNCTDKQDWWRRRSELDCRMKSLIETLETQVLGCWRGALIPTGPEPGLAEEAARLHPQLCRCGWRHSDPTLLQVVLNAAPLLGPGDVQALAFGLCPGKPRKAQLLLQEAVEKRRACATQTGGSLVLVLDKHLQKLPWESMACLKAVPVTRLPSLRFLLSYSLAQKQAGSVLSRGVNPSSTFYVLNPHSNLLGTEERFRGWFESEPGWRGVARAVPSPEQMQAALLEHDLYIYVGHGAGARLLDGQTIAQLDCRAVTLLFGCSSAALAVRGSLEGSGIILKYIMAGCPLVLGNLWDVTDRDIDRYAQALLQGWLRGGSGAPFLSYVAQARQAPKLKYLIGAAPVAYGLPVCLQ